jgi:hypothetical protein
MISGAGSLGLELDVTRWCITARSRSGGELPSVVNMASPTSNVERGARATSPMVACALFV